MQADACPAGSGHRPHRRGSPALRGGPRSGRGAPPAAPGPRAPGPGPPRQRHPRRTGRDYNSQQPSRHLPAAVALSHWLPVSLESGEERVAPPALPAPRSYCGRGRRRAVRDGCGGGSIGRGAVPAGRRRGGGGAFPSPPRRREGAAAAGCEAAMRYGRGGAAGGSGAREAGAVGRVTGRGGPAGRQAGSWGGGPEAVGPAVGAGAGEVGVGGRGAGRGSPGRAAEVGCAGRAGGFAGGAAGDGGGGLRKARSVEQVHTWGDGAGELGGTPCCGVALEAEGDGNNLGVGSGKAGPALGWRGRGGGWPGAA